LTASVIAGKGKGPLLHGWSLRQQSTQIKVKFKRIEYAALFRFTRLYRSKMFRMKENSQVPKAGKRNNNKCLNANI
jgi:hypothetical protein